jgi:hypothetical protein
VKLPYILKVTYPMAAVMVKIHSLAVAMRAPRSMVLAVCDILIINTNFLFSVYGDLFVFYLDTFLPP